MFVSLWSVLCALSRHFTYFLAAVFLYGAESGWVFLQSTPVRGNDKWTANGIKGSLKVSRWMTSLVDAEWLSTLWVKDNPRRLFVISFKCWPIFKILSVSLSRKFATKLSLNTLLKLTRVVTLLCEILLLMSKTSMQRALARTILLKHDLPKVLA